LAGIAGSNPNGAWLSVVCVVCCQVDVSATGWSLVQRSPTECVMSECDREALLMRWPWPTGGGGGGGAKKKIKLLSQKKIPEDGVLFFFFLVRRFAALDVPRSW